jgi:ribosomal protein RSM22 (predicted rRNA methylase)
MLFDYVIKEQSCKMALHMMNIPDNLQQAIDKETAKFSFHEILDAREELTNRYRSRRPEKQGFITTEAQRCSYVAVRMPATYAVIRRVMEELQNRVTGTNPKTLLDLGAGPGTAMWAACSVFPSIQKMSLLEKDAELAALGRRLAQYSERIAIREATWQIADMEKEGQCPSHDIVILSYSIGELSQNRIAPVIQASWQATDQFLVVIEPGTPVGFERIRAIRSQLISLGGHLVAPCPHELPCPMAGGDWCHFSERIERSSLHRRLKEGSLGYEDEKFSYVIAAKNPFSLPQARVLRHPLKRSGHVVLTLCTPEGLKQETVSKKNGENYKQARKLEWGDVYNPRNGSSR